MVLPAGTTKFACVTCRRSKPLNQFPTTGNRVSRSQTTVSGDPAERRAECRACRDQRTGRVAA